MEPSVLQFLDIGGVQAPGLRANQRVPFAHHHARSSYLQLLDERRPAILFLLLPLLLLPVSILVSHGAQLRRGDPGSQMTAERCRAPFLPVALRRCFDTSYSPARCS